MVSAFIFVMISVGVLPAQRSRTMTRHRNLERRFRRSSARRARSRTFGTRIAEHLDLARSGVIERGAAGEQKMDPARDEVIHRGSGPR